MRWDKGQSSSITCWKIIFSRPDQYIVLWNACLHAIEVNHYILLYRQHVPRMQMHLMCVHISVFTMFAYYCTHYTVRLEHMYRVQCESRLYRPYSGLYCVWRICHHFTNIHSPDLFVRISFRLIYFTVILINTPLIHARKTPVPYLTVFILSASLSPSPKFIATIWKQV